MLGRGMSVFEGRGLHRVKVVGTWGGGGLWNVKNVH